MAPPAGSGLGHSERMRFVSAEEEEEGVAVGQPWQFPAGSWKGEIGIRGRAAEIREEEREGKRERLMLSSPASLLPRAFLGWRRESAFREKTNRVKVMA